MKTAITKIFEKYNFGMAILIIILLVILGLGFAFGIFCLQGWIFMLLWNWLAVELLGASVLNYWICVGIVFALNFLGKVIFGRHKAEIKKED